MSGAVRVFVLIGALFAFWFMIQNIRKAKLVIADSIYWFMFAIVMLLIGIFPQISFFFARALRVASASNLVYLVIIAMLLLRVFQQDIKLSQLNTKLQKLAQDSAIFQADQKKDDSEESSN